VRHLLVGVAPDDPLALVLASGVVAAVTVASIWLPARRAAEADPLEAIRAE
jgi:ABC-type antimicrobial peptide transport system permease subunit